MDWIKCSERMPEYAISVIVYDKEYDVVDLASYYNSGWSWDDIDDGLSDDPCNVTHWQPLPKPPKETSNE